ncbi:MAG TPA: hypothetical protein VEK07_23550 [Polyangiaceae bacterium]|nr:hypothetical protein [Polyangiaceae bacterium]
MKAKIAWAGCCAAAILAEVPGARAQQESAEPDVQVQPSEPSATGPSVAGPSAQSAQGQWVYTDQYGWVWVPAGTDTSAVGDEPYAYLYAPAYGWTWLVSPWGWGPFTYGYWPLWGSYRYIPRHYGYGPYGYGRGLGWGWGPGRVGPGVRPWGPPVHGGYWGGGHPGGGTFGGGHPGGTFGGGHYGGGGFGGGHMGGGGHR